MPPRPAAPCLHAPLRDLHNRTRRKWPPNASVRPLMA